MATFIASQAAAAPSGYFPPAAPKSPVKCGHSSAIDQFRDQWYGKHLKAAEEPPLYGQAGRPRGLAAETLRFTWLRTFHAPIVVRVEWTQAGSAQLIAKQLSGRGGYELGGVVQRVTRHLRAGEAQQLRTLLTRTQIFEQPTTECVAQPGGTIRVVADGAEWIFEDVDPRGYHVAVWQSPEGGRVRDLGLALLALTGWRVDPVY